MASLHDWKPAFQERLKPWADRLDANGFTPNQVTLVAVGLAALEGFLLLVWPGTWFPLLLLPFVLFVRLALNAIDGMIARERGLATPLGKVLNEIGDVIADGFLYLPLMAIPGAPAVLIALVVLFGIAAELAGVLGEVLGDGRRYEGPFGKSERALAFGLIALVLALGAAAGWWLDLVLLAMVVAQLRTLWNRAAAAIGRPTTFS